MALFGLFKSKQERDTGEFFRKMTETLFPLGEQDIVRDCKRIDALTHQRIPQPKLRDFVIGCKALMFTSEVHDEARFVEGFVRHSVDGITSDEAYDVYVYLEGEASYYDNSSRQMKATGKTVSANSEALAGKMPWIYSQGTHDDTVKDGYGDYGMVLTNPIPSISVRSSTRYLSKLRFGGQPVEFKRGGVNVSKVTPGLVDIYELTCNGQNVGTIFICPYHKRNSKRAPKGFTLV